MIFDKSIVYTTLNADELKIGSKEEDLRTQADSLAEEYCKDGCYDDYPNPSLAESIDIWDDIKDAFIAGYMARNKE